MGVCVCVGGGGGGCVEGGMGCDRIVCTFCRSLSNYPGGGGGIIGDSIGVYCICKCTHQMKICPPRYRLV